MEKRQSKGKWIGLIVGIVVVVALISGVIAAAATGMLARLFSSDKAKAFELLSQVPEKMTTSAVGEQLGQKELLQNMLEKGMDVSYKISDIKSDEMTQSGMDLSGYSMSLDTQIDLANKKAGGKLSVEKDGAALSAQGYASLEEKKVAFSLPELISDKVFTMTAEGTDSVEMWTRLEKALSRVPDLKDSFVTYLEEQGTYLYDESACTKLDNGYRITISKEALDQVFDELNNYVAEQQETIGLLEEDLGATKGDVASAVSELVSEVKANTQEINLELTGADGTLSGVSTEFSSGEYRMTLQMNFDSGDEKDVSELTLELLQGETSVAKIYCSQNSRSGDVCADDVKLELVAPSAGTYSVEVNTTLDVKNNNAFTTSTSLRMEDANSSDVITSTAEGKGSIKNLQPGECITILYDELSVSGSEGSSMSYGMECTMSVLDGGITMPSGEEVALTTDNAQSTIYQYMTEAQTKLMAILSTWGAGLYA